MDYKKIMELMLAYLEEAIIVIDKDYVIIDINQPSTDITGFTAEDAIGKTVFEVFPNINKTSSTFYSVLTTGVPVVEQVQDYVNYIGKSVSILTTTVPIIENGEIKGAIEIFKDLTHVKELSEKILLLQTTLYGKKNENKFLPNGTQYNLSDMIGASTSMQKLKEKAVKVATSNSPVFVFGETGTGKELLIQGLHNVSNRKDKPFIAQNCAALPENLLESILFGTVQGSFTGAKDKEGLFELADGGTLFLDELNSMTLNLQSKLLRVLQDGMIRRVGSVKTKHVDVRVIVATNVEPKILLEEQKLREDLYYRLNVIYFHIPALRDKKEDIPDLVDHFIEISNKKMNKNINGVTSEVLDYFKGYNWPGNIRELENTIESAMNFADEDLLTMEDFQTQYSSEVPEEVVNASSPAIPKGKGLKYAVEEYEKYLIKTALEETNNNCAKAARNLKVPKQTLHGKIKRYELDCIE
jgi:arginine utilization regulatory protein